MRKTKSRKLTALARGLRRRQTDAERALWLRLRSKQLQGMKFRRQQPRGPYIVDFVCIERKLVVEIDGGRHGDGEMSEAARERMLSLEEDGYRVLRFWNNEVLGNMEGVLEQIGQALR